jgi:transcriptional regulator with XRE-family HTH domain
MVTTEEQLERARAIGARIRAHRARRAWSVAQLAVQAGISSDHLYTLERGEHVAQQRTLSRIAEALHEPLATLTGEAQS